MTCAIESYWWLDHFELIRYAVVPDPFTNV